MGTLYTKPAVRPSWGQTASNADLQDPGSTYESAGWQLGVKPPRQYFNWVLNWATAAVRYFCQRGISDFDATETYSISSITLGPDGLVYQSLTNNNIGSTPASSPSQWGPILVPTPGSSDRTQKVPNTSWVGSNFLPVGSTFTAINGVLQNPQVPSGAVTQWQGSLSIGGGQITSAVAAANTLLMAGVGSYATFHWTAQSGQPPWVLGGTASTDIYLWNPANFNVANANTVAGLSVSTGASGNTVMARDGSGYAYAQYFSQASANNENPAIGQFMVTNGGDNFLRKASPSAVASALGSFTTANSPFSSSGYQKLLSGGIIQGGRTTVSGTTNVTFPITFPNRCLGMAFTNEGTTNQIFLNQPPSASFFQTANGNGVINWIAFGY